MCVPWSSDKPYFPTATWCISNCQKVGVPGRKQRYVEPTQPYAHLPLMVIEAVLILIVCRAARRQICFGYWSSQVVSMGPQLFPHGSEVPRQDKERSSVLNTSFFPVPFMAFRSLANQWRESIPVLLQWLRLATPLQHKVFDHQRWSGLSFAYKALSSDCCSGITAARSTVIGFDACQICVKTPSFTDKCQFDFSSC